MHFYLLYQHAVMLWISVKSFEFFISKKRGDSIQFSHHSKMQFINTRWLCPQSIEILFDDSTENSLYCIIHSIFPLAGMHVDLRLFRCLPLSTQNKNAIRYLQFCLFWYTQSASVLLLLVFFRICFCLCCCVSHSTMTLYHAYA